MRKLFSILLSGILCIGLLCGSFPVEASATSEMELLKRAVSHLKEQVDALENQPSATFKLQGDALLVSYDGGTSWTSLGNVRGEDGKDGKDGIDGKDGKDGTDGLNGMNGADGKNGVDGKDGTDGKDGIDGTNGIDGLDGKDGINGKDGTNGIDGKNGKDGITPLLRINAGTQNWEVSYDEGVSWAVLSAAKTGGSSDNGLWLIPLAIACVSLMGTVVVLVLYLQERRKNQSM